MDPEFYAFVRYLRQKFPHPRGKPIIVRTRYMSTLYGSCNSTFYQCRITISNEQEHNFAIESLCHEWAHMLDCKNWREDFKEEHRTSWGKHYARVYRSYWKFLKEYKSGA